MRTTSIAAVILAAALLTACGSGDASPGKPTSKPKATASKQTPTKASPTLALGKPARTAGAQNPVEGPGGGELEVTPTTVVYSAKGTGETPENDTFAVVTLKQKALADHPVSPSAPIEGGGWQWIAPDGQAIQAGNGSAFNVVPETYGGGGPVQPGSWAWDVAVFDLTKAQRGGTLVYTDGAGKAYRWKVPAQDTGPEVAKLKKELDW